MRLVEFQHLHHKMEYRRVGLELRNRILILKKKNYTYTHTHAQRVQPNVHQLLFFPNMAK